MFTMYAQVADKKGSNSYKLYDPSESGDEYVVTSPVLVMEESAAGKLTFNLPPTNNCFQYFYTTTDQNGEANALNLYVDVRKDGDIIWKGRVVSKEIDFWNCIDVTCEGLLAVLNDTIQPPNYFGSLMPSTYIESLLAVHNARVNDSNRMIFIGNTFDPSGVAVPKVDQYTNYETTLECIIEKVLKNVGGRIVLRYDKYQSKWFLDYYSKYEEEISQRIEFGKNLFDYSRSMTSEDYCTVVVPRGKQLDEGQYEDIKAYTTVASAKNGDGSIYVELKGSDFNPAISSDKTPTALYGRIEKVVDWNEIDDPDLLLEVAKEWLKDKQFGNMELEVSAMDMYYAGAVSDSIKVGDVIRVVSSPHGLDRTFPVTKMEIKIDNPEDTLFTLGAAVKLSMTSKSNAQTKETLGLLDDIPTQQRLTTVFKKEAVDMINAATHGYVNIIQNEETGAEEFVVSDVVDYKAPYKHNVHEGVWRWTFGGLAFQKTYASTNQDDTTLALTRDGKINADLISTGHMVADIIQGGVIADMLSPHNFEFNLSTGKYKIKSLDELTGKNGTIAKIQANISLNASNISSTVELVTGLKEDLYGNDDDIGELAKLRSSITQNAGNIEAKVSLSDYTGAEIASRINLSAKSVVIESSHISLSGKTIALTSDKITIKSTKFSVDKDGYIKSTGGEIGGFTIDDHCIRTSNLSDASTGSIALDTKNFSRVINKISLKTLRFAIGGNFGVTSDGHLYAGGVNISGNIYAGGGTIGGFTIDGSSIRTAELTDNGAGSVALSKADFTRNVAGANRKNLRLAIGSKFGVSSSGGIFADGAYLTNATIVGGSFKVQTSSANYNFIELSTGAYKSEFSPMQLRVGLNNSDAWTSVGTGSIILGISGIQRLYADGTRFTLINSSSIGRFNWDGDKINLAYTAHGDLAQTGYMNTNSNSITLPKNTMRAVVSLSVGAGRWVITAQLRFSGNGNATGYRNGNISTGSGSTSGVNGAEFRVPAVSANVQTGSCLATIVDQAGTYYVNAYQTSAGDVTAYASIQAIRIA